MVRVCFVVFRRDGGGYIHAPSCVHRRCGAESLVLVGGCAASGVIVRVVAQPAKDVVSLSFSLRDSAMSAGVTTRLSTHLLERIGDPSMVKRAVPLGSYTKFIVESKDEKGCWEGMLGTDKRAVWYS